MMSRLLRDRGLALIALILALVGLVATASGSHAAQTEVVVAARGVASGAVVEKAAIRFAAIDTRDLTPGMARRADEVVGRTASVRLARGDYVLRTAVGRPAESLVLREGERAVPLSIDPTAAPPLSLLHAGAHVDVVAEREADRAGPARSRLIARDLTLLVPARRSDAGVVATVRAPLSVALALATAQAQAHRLRLFVRPEVAGGDG
jgi:Flp pilus assembly protein CpaB